MEATTDLGIWHCAGVTFNVLSSLLRSKDVSRSRCVAEKLTFLFQLPAVDSKTHQGSKGSNSPIEATTDVGIWHCEGVTFNELSSLLRSKVVCTSRSRNVHSDANFKPILQARSPKASPKVPDFFAQKARTLR